MRESPLTLSAEEQARIERLEAAVRAAHPAEHAQLLALADDPAIARRYRELAQQSPEILREETIWLTEVIREALGAPEQDVPWAVLYLTRAYAAVLCRKIEHRLNPRRGLATPSPFVYAMQ